VAGRGRALASGKVFPRVVRGSRLVRAAPPTPELHGLSLWTPGKGGPPRFEGLWAQVLPGVLTKV
jgi:hypothetical protein